MKIPLRVYDAAYRVYIRGDDADPEDKGMVMDWVKRRYQERGTTDPVTAAFWVLSLKQQLGVEGSNG